ncbi:hypothetical protein PoB_004758100 [Plakobranchus ocellatus]|uniref:Uncharacterized protein n=1 Tax=Plakobranchus ocellatus TaxID=259542 RepID=A0AAV4BPX9_9GAST|nr:hypothetical protein PoB_004758100 [Plakobranchus ocellatus]
MQQREVAALHTVGDCQDSYRSSLICLHLNPYAARSPWILKTISHNDVLLAVTQGSYYISNQEKNGGEYRLAQSDKPEQLIKLTAVKQPRLANGRALTLPRSFTWTCVHILLSPEALLDKGMHVPADGQALSAAEVVSPVYRSVNTETAGTERGARER